MADGGSNIHAVGFPAMPAAGGPRPGYPYGFVPPAAAISSYRPQSAVPTSSPYGPVFVMSPPPPHQIQDQQQQQMAAMRQSGTFSPIPPVPQMATQPVMVPMAYFPQGHQQVPMVDPTSGIAFMYPNVALDPAQMSQGQFGVNAPHPQAVQVQTDRILG